MSTHITWIRLQVVCVVFACTKIFQILLNYFLRPKNHTPPRIHLVAQFHTNSHLLLLLLGIFHMLFFCVYKNISNFVELFFVAKKSHPTPHPTLLRSFTRFGGYYCRDWQQYPPMQPTLFFISHHATVDYLAGNNVIIVWVNTWQQRTIEGKSTHSLH